MSFDKKPNQRRKKYINENTGMQYITINVNSLDAYIERLQNLGVRFLGNTPYPLPDGRHFLLVQDPDGTFIELIGSINNL